MLRDAVMERKTLKAEKNASMPVGGSLRAWFSLLVKFTSSVMFGIVLGRSENCRFYEERCYMVDENLGQLAPYHRTENFTCRG